MPIEENATKRCYKVQKLVYHVPSHSYSSYILKSVQNRRVKLKSNCHNRSIQHLSHHFWKSENQAICTLLLIFKSTPTFRASEEQTLYVNQAVPMARNNCNNNIWLQLEKKEAQIGFRLYLCICVNTCRVSTSINQNFKNQNKKLRG